MKGIVRNAIQFYPWGDGWSIREQGRLTKAVVRAMLVEDLGYRRTDRLLVVNSDDFGMCHAANEAVWESLGKGIVTSATVMMPCPWAYDAVKRWSAQPDFAVGVHLTLTSEWRHYRWRPVAPVAEVPGLVDSDGFMWRRVQDVYEHATPEQAYVECRAQIELARSWGLDPTHLDSHMETLQIHPAYLEVYARLAQEYRLPLRMASQSDFAAGGQPGIRAQFAARGIVFPDELVLPERRRADESARAFILRTIRELSAGVNELFIHASLMTPELQAIFSGGEQRAEEFRLFTEDEGIRECLAEENVILIDYRPLRAWQRTR